MNLIKRFGLWKKFTLLGLLCLALIIAPTLMYQSEVTKALVLANKEQQGLPQIQLMLNIIQRTQQHRGLSARLLQDDSIIKNDQRAKAEELEAAIFSYEIYLDKNPNEQHREAFKGMVDFWHGIHQKISRRQLDYTESFELHTALIDMQLHYLQSLADFYQLNLDPDTNGYFSIQASLIQLPELIENLAQVRGHAVGLLVKGSATNDERIQLKALLLASESSVKQIDFNLKNLLSAKQKNYENIYQNYQPTKLQYQTIFELTHSEILAKEEFSASAENFYSVFTSALNNYYSHVHFAIDQLDTVLTERVSSTKKQLYVMLLYVFCSTLIVMFLYVRFVRRLVQELGGEPKYTIEVLQAIARGDLDSEIETPHPQSLLANVKYMQEALKESDRLKSEFIATASHELKTPLTAIGSALSLSVTGQLGVLPDAAVNYLSVAQRNSLRLAELINDFLDVNKLSVGKLEFDMRVQPLMPIIDDAKLSMASYARKYGVHIIAGPRFEYLLVNIDARRLRQVLKNLLSNAIKFSKKGEEIIINTIVHFDKVRIEVIDHGCGIADEQKDKLFQKFSRGYVSEPHSADGVGLGLAISKQLVIAMGGELSFTSSLGAGSCFFVDFPLEELNSD